MKALNQTFLIAVMSTVLLGVNGFAADAKKQCIPQPGQDPNSTECVVYKAARPSNVRVSNPAVLSVEGLGRAATWSLNFDYAFRDQFSAGVGYGAAALKGGTTAGMIPLYVNFYLTEDGSSPFFTPAIAILTSSASQVNGKSYSSITFNDSAVIPSLGFGYELRTDPGLLFRGTVYALFTSKVNAWVGFGLGYAF